MMTIVPATIEHAEELVGNLRANDLSEVQATGQDPLFIIKYSFFKTPRPYSWVHDGKIGAMFGVAETELYNMDRGAPWLLTTSKFDEYPTGIARTTLRMLREIKKPYKYLENYVDDRYEVCKKWLAWLGFTLAEAKPYGPDQVPFRRFFMEVN